MSIIRAGYSGPKEIKYLFIDGGCLRQLIFNVSKTYFGGKPIDINYSCFTREFKKVFYYDALPPRKNNELDEEYNKRIDEKNSFFNDLRSINSDHVYEEVSRRRRKVVEQKEVDILIAVDILKLRLNLLISVSVVGASMTHPTVKAELKK